MALARGPEPRFMHVNSVSSSPGWLSQNKLTNLVEILGVDPSPSLLQRLTAPRRYPHWWCPSSESNRVPSLFRRPPDLAIPIFGRGRGIAPPTSSFMRLASYCCSIPILGGELRSRVASRWGTAISVGTSTEYAEPFSRRSRHPRRTSLPGRFHGTIDRRRD
jgi:hypothetical protein